MEEKRTELLERILPLVGGESNVTRHSFAGKALYITLKDRSAADLEALQTLDGVTGVELTHGRLKIDLSEKYYEEENQMADNKKIAQDILEAVGGKENVTAATHCMTRLRLNLRDASKAPEEAVKNIPGVLGVVQAGGQFQVIIGQNVPKVYKEFCAMTGLATQDAINENLDAPKEKLTLKKIGSNILNYMSGSMTPLIPVLMAAGMCRVLSSLLGPSMLNVIAVDSDFYILLDFFYDAGFYFIPILIGYNAAKKLNIPGPMGAYMGCILMAPDFAAMVANGTPFTILGIPVTMVNYAQSVLPILLCVAFMALIYKFFEKIVPEILSTIFVPFLTVMVASPIGLLALAPVGTFLSNTLIGGLTAFSQATGFFGVAVMGALWEFLVMTGMHVPVILAFQVQLVELGYQTGAILGGHVATWATWGVALGAFLRLKNKQEKTASLGFFASGVLGGITEPTLYGLCMKYTRCFIPLMIGGFAGGAWMGITQVRRYTAGSASILNLLRFVGGSTSNLVNAIIASVISLSVAAVATYFIGFRKEELKP